MGSTNCEWNDLPLDMQHEILNILYFDNDRADYIANSGLCTKGVCHKRLVCKQFRNVLKDVRYSLWEPDVIRNVYDQNVHLDTLIWMQKTGKLIKCNGKFWDKYIHAALWDVSSRGLIRVLMWLYENYPKFLEGKEKYYLMRCAQDGGHYDTNKWLDENVYSDVVDDW